MATTHEEELLDSGIEESFPASDPVSVFVPIKQKPLPWEKQPVAARRTWPVAALVTSLLGLAGAAAKVASDRRAARARTATRRTTTLAVAGVTAGAALGAWAWRQRNESPADGSP